MMKKRKMVEKWCKKKTIMELYIPTYRILYILIKTAKMIS